MKGAQEQAARAIVAAIRAIEFDARLTDSARLDADVADAGGGGVRIEVRHPRVERGGVRWLVAIVSLESRTPEVVYAVPTYRPAIERAVARMGGAR